MGETIMRNGSYRYVSAIMSGLIMGSALWLGIALVRTGGPSARQVTAEPITTELRGSLR
ncbi:hypothetical protein [Bradyrhizobium sp. Tv2a-2]|uniref:hypothetical protein n=1 Tax=Bradyrhizobium sp. Tv2a-2 TaxID=113395 RepID=UPI0012ECA629|nr:hypothetical protein [Bradyrhizobium sp. Tv2a-2]